MLLLGLGLMMSECFRMAWVLAGKEFALVLGAEIELGMGVSLVLDEHRVV